MGEISARSCGVQGTSEEQGGVSCSLLVMWTVGWGAGGLLVVSLCCGGQVSKSALCRRTWEWFLVASCWVSLGCSRCLPSTRLMKWSMQHGAGLGSFRQRGAETNILDFGAWELPLFFVLRLQIHLHLLWVVSACSLCASNF